MSHQSVGHLLFLDREHDAAGWEYYAREDQVYRASRANPLDVSGYRQGGRWECSLTQWDRRKEILTAV